MVRSDYSSDEHLPRNMVREEELASSVSQVQAGWGTISPSLCGKGMRNRTPVFRFGDGHNTIILYQLVAELGFEPRRLTQRLMRPSRYQTSDIPQILFFFYKSSAIWTYPTIAQILYPNIGTTMFTKYVLFHMERLKGVKPLISEFVAQNVFHYNSSVGTSY